MYNTIQSIIKIQKECKWMVNRFGSKKVYFILLCAYFDITGGWI